jgi:hypothetical protein
MPDAAWKRWERTVALALGGDRTGPRGLGLPDALDTADGLAPEAKCYQDATTVFFTAALRKAIAQARVNQLNVAAPFWGVFIKDRDIRGPEGEYVVLPMAYFKYKQSEGDQHG